MTRNLNLPPGITIRDIDPPHSDEAEQCQGPRCAEWVEPHDRYSDTPCGAFCVECFDEHLKRCEVCRKEFEKV